MLLYHHKDFSIPSRHINIFPWAGMAWKWLIFQNPSCLLLVTKKSHISSLSVLLEAQGVKEAWCDSRVGTDSNEVYENTAKGSQWKIIFTTNALSQCDDHSSVFVVSFIKEGYTEWQANTRAEGNRWYMEALCMNININIWWKTSHSPSQFFPSFLLSLSNQIN